MAAGPARTGMRRDDHPSEDALSKPLSTFAIEPSSYLLWGRRGVFAAERIDLKSF